MKHTDRYTGSLHDSRMQLFHRFAMLAAEVIQPIHHRRLPRLDAPLLDRRSRACGTPCEAVGGPRVPVRFSHRLHLFAV
jgi:hypothetical protein